MTYGNLKSEIDNNPVLPISRMITNNINTPIPPEDVMLSNTVILVDSDIVSLPTVPFEIIPSTVGKANIVFSVLLRYDFSGGAYSNVDPTNYVIVVNDINGNYDVVTSNSAGSANFDEANKKISILSVYGFTPLTGDFAGLLTTFEADNDIANWVNEPTYLAAFNGALENYQGGNVNNTIKVTVYYTLEDA